MQLAFARGLDRKIAAAAGIPDDLPADEYAARLKAARTAYYIRLANERWSRDTGR